MAKGFGIKENIKNNSGKKANFLPLLNKMMEAASKNKLQTFLQDNVNEINENLLHNFCNWTRIKLSTVNSKEIKERYYFISLISQTIHKFYLGNRAINLEISITGYEFVSAIFTQQRNFKEKLLWAGNLCNLSLAYIDRIHGNRSENLEKAISVCQQALTINLRQVYPKLWADIQNNLGGAYKQRIIGEKSENIEQAIKHFKAALEVFIHSKFPSEWAKLQANLGNTYLEKLMGDRAENIEVAIELIETSLQVYTKDKFPQEWANTQNSLAGAYHERIRRDRAENLEKSIFYCKNALEVFTPKKFPQFWVETQMNLASAYRDRIDGNKAENLRLAIEIYQFILPVAREGFPSQWACIQNNLGIAYSKINHPESQEKAIVAFEAALQIYNRETFPQNWAMAQKSLGLLYSERCYGERTENLEKAITYYQAAFQTFSLDAFPNYWAKNQNNLAIAYTKLDKIDKAIACCQSALKVFTPDTFPVECFTAARQFGEIAARTKRWSESIEGYGIAIEAIEISRSWTIYDFRRQKIVEQAFDVYHNMVKACINAGQLDKAIETVERSRSKRL